MNAKARRKTQKSAFYGAPTKDADHRRRNGEGHPAVCLPKGIGSCRRLPRFRAYGKCLSLSYVYIISPALPRVRRGHLAVCPPKGVGSCRKLPRFRAYGKRRYRLISPSRPKRKGRTLPRAWGRAPCGTAGGGGVRLSGPRGRAVPPASEGKAVPEQLRAAQARTPSERPEAESVRRRRAHAP